MTGSAAGIVERLRACDPAAPAELFDLVFDTVYAYASAQTATRRDAAELAQDTLQSALRGIDDAPRIVDDVDLVGWLFRVARTRAADLFPSSSAPGGGGPPPDAEPEADGFAAIRSLRAAERDVVVCAVLLGYDVEDTSRLLGMPPERVSDTLRVALASLRPALASSGALA